MAPTPSPLPVDWLLSDEEVELFGPYRRLLPVWLDGQLTHVPEGNSLLRALQYLELRVGLVRLPWGRYCWNDTKGCCEMSFRRAPGEPVLRGRACRTTVEAGMELLDLPPGGQRCR